VALAAKKFADDKKNSPPSTASSRIIVLFSLRLQSQAGQTARFASQFVSAVSAESFTAQTAIVATTVSIPGEGPPPNVQAWTDCPSVYRAQLNQDRKYSTQTDTSYLKLRTLYILRYQRRNGPFYRIHRTKQPSLRRFTIICNCS
jgi:hypothetical protein